jgi:histidinol dehydrogenase
MKVYEYPERNIWPELLCRPTHEATHLNAVVAEVLADVKARGDQAVREYEERFDKVCLDSLAVTEEEMQEAEQLVSEELKQSLLLAHQNIRKFHADHRDRKSLVHSPGNDPVQVLQFRFRQADPFTGF